MLISACLFVRRQTANRKDLRMIAFNQLIQWRNLIAPLILPLFFSGAVITTAICGVFGILSGIFLLPDSPFLGIMVIALTMAVSCVALATVRLVAEFFL